MTDILSLANITKSFGETSVLKSIDLSVRAGERHALIGPNGAGKSTLFDLISGRARPDGGTISLRGSDIAGLKPQHIYRKGLCRSFQVSALFPTMTVFENIRCACLKANGVGYDGLFPLDTNDAIIATCETVLTHVGLTDSAFVPAGELAYAQQRALEIGITIAGDNDVILLDEPTAGMSHSETDRAVDLIRTLTVGKTLLMVEHDMGVVFNLADRISVIVDGRVIATDTPDAIRNNPAVQSAYLGPEGPAHV